MRKVVGHIDVDAGIVQVGDPCYTLRHSTHPPKSERATVDKVIFDALLEMIPIERLSEVKQMLRDSEEIIEKEDRFDRDSEGVNYFEMIERLIDHDSDKLKLDPKWLKNYRETVLRDKVIGAGDPNNWWNEPRVTSLAPAPHDNHYYQGVYAPYMPDMQGSPHGVGAGLVVGSGYGDGSYAVEVEWDDEPDVFPEIEPTVIPAHDGLPEFTVDKGRPEQYHHRIKSVTVTFIGDWEEADE